MFEALVSDVINRVLGAYVQNVNKEQLSVGIWSGDVTLKNLELRPDALTALNLPVVVTRGVVGQLWLFVPWSNLKTQRIRLVLEDVFALVEPNSKLSYSPEREAQTMAKVKQQLLAELDASAKRIHSANKQQQQADAAKSSMTDNVVAKLLNNIQLEVTNLHLRYEDDMSIPGSPFSLGLTIAKIAIKSEDQSGPQSDKAPLRLLDLDSLSVYFYFGAKSLRSSDPSVFIKSFRDGVLHADKAFPATETPILRPVCGHLSVASYKSVKAATEAREAHHTLSFDFDELSVCLADQHFAHLTSLSEAFVLYKRAERHRKFHPAVPLHGNARAYWLFALSSLLERKREVHRRYTWAVLKENGAYRRRYFSAYKAFLCASSDASRQQYQKELSPLEDHLYFEQIRTFRQLVQHELQHEIESKSVDVLSQLSPTPSSTAIAPSPSSSWGNFLKWTGSSAGGATAASSPQLSSITLEELQRLSDDLDEGVLEEASAISTHPDYVSRTLSFSLKTCRLQLAHHKRQLGTNSVFASMSLEKVAVAAKEMSNRQNFEVSVSLQALQLDNPHHAHLFPSMIVPSKRLSDKEPLLSVRVIKNPEHKRSDYELVLVLRSVDIVYNRAFIEDAMKFVHVGLLPKNLLAEVRDAATTQLVDLGTRAAKELRRAPSAKIPMAYSVDISAPKILVPSSPTDSTASMTVLDLGRIVITHIETQRPPPHTRDCAANLKANYTESSIALSNLQMFTTCPEKMHVESVSLVSPISMALSFWMRRHDKYTDQVRRANPIFVVHGDLQLLEIAISRHSYAAFMLFLDTISNPIPVANGAADLTLEAPEVPEAAAQPASPRSAHAPASPRSAQPASPRSAHAPASPRSAQPASPRSTHAPASPRSAHAPASPARLHTSASAHPENEDEADEFFDASDVLHMVADPMLVSTSVMGASWLFSQQPSATKFAAAAAPGKQSKPARTVVAEEEEAEVDTISQTFAVNLNISEMTVRLDRIVTDGSSKPFASFVLASVLISSGDDPEKFFLNVLSNSLVGTDHTQTEEFAEIVKLPDGFKFGIVSTPKTMDTTLEASRIWFIVNRETVVEALLFLENDSLPNSSLAGTVTTAVKKSKKKKIARVTCTLDEGHFLLNQNLEKLFSIDVQGLKFVNAHDPAAIEDSDVSINVRAARASDARRLEDHRWREIFVLPYTSTGLSARWKFYEPETSGFPGYNIHFGVESSGLQFVHLADFTDQLIFFISVFLDMRTILFSAGVNKIIDGDYSEILMSPMTRIKYDIRVGSSSISLPVDIDREQSLSLQVDQVTVQTTEDLSTNIVSIHGIAGAAMLDLTNTSSLFSGFDIDVTLTEEPTNSVPLPTCFPVATKVLSLRGQVSPLNINISAEIYEVMQAVLSVNLGREGKGAKAPLQQQTPIKARGVPSLTGSNESSPQQRRLSVPLAVSTAVSSSTSLETTVTSLRTQQEAAVRMVYLVDVATPSLTVNFVQAVSKTMARSVFSDISLDLLWTGPKMLWHFGLGSAKMETFADGVDERFRSLLSSSASGESLLKVAYTSWDTKKATADMIHADGCNAVQCWDVKFDVVQMAFHGITFQAITDIFSSKHPAGAHARQRAETITSIHHSASRKSVSEHVHGVDDMEVKCTAKEFHMLAHNNVSPLAHFAMSDFVSTYATKNMADRTGFDYSVIIGHIVVTDERAGTTLYKQLLGMTKNEERSLIVMRIHKPLFDEKISTDTPPVLVRPAPKWLADTTAASLEHCSYAMHLRVASVQVIYDAALLEAFRWHLTMTSASTAATSPPLSEPRSGNQSDEAVVVNNSANESEDAKQFLVDVDVAVPTILAPLDQTERDLVRVELGRLRARNQLVTEVTDYDVAVQAVLHFELLKMRVDLVRPADAKRPLLHLVEDIDVKGEYSRRVPLSTSSAIAAFSVCTVAVPQIRIQATHSELQFLLALAKGILAKQAEAANAEEELNAAQSVDLLPDLASSVHGSTVQSDPLGATGNVSSPVKSYHQSFTAKKAVAKSSFQAIVEFEGASVDLQHESLEPFVSADMSSLYVSMLKHNQHMTIHAKMDSLQLRDAQANADSNVVHLLRPLPQATAVPGPPVINIKYEVNEQEETTLHVQVHRPQIVLLFGTIYALGDFFSDFELPASATASTTAASAPTDGGAGDLKTYGEYFSRKRVVAVLEVHQPDVYVVLNPANLRSACIVLSLSAKVKYDVDRALEKVDLLVSGLELFSTQWDLAADAKIAIVDPLNIKLAVERLAYETDDDPLVLLTKGELKMDDILGRVLYSDVKLFQSIFATIPSYDDWVRSTAKTSTSTARLGRQSPLLEAADPAGEDDLCIPALQPTGSDADMLLSETYASAPIPIKRFFADDTIGGGDLEEPVQPHRDPHLRQHRRRHRVPTREEIRLTVHAIQLMVVDDREEDVPAEEAVRPSKNSSTTSLSKGSSASSSRRQSDNSDARKKGIRKHRVMPLIEAELRDVKVDLKDWSKAPNVRFVSELSIDHYHPRLSVWEPALEPLRLDVQMKAVFDRAGAAHWGTQITGVTFANIILTPWLLKTLYRLQAIVEEETTAAAATAAASAASAVSTKNVPAGSQAASPAATTSPVDLAPHVHVQIEGRHFAPFLLQNRTGVDVCFACIDSTEHKMEVAPGGDCEFSFQDTIMHASVRDERRGHTRPVNRAIFVQLAGSVVIKEKISVDSDGQCGYELPPLTQHLPKVASTVPSLSMGLVVQVTTDETLGRKTIVLRSTNMFVNKTDRAVMLNFERALDSDLEVGPIQQGEVFYIPLSVSDNMCFRVKPVVNFSQNRWTDWEKLLRLEVNERALLTSGPENAKSKAFIYSAMLKISKCDKGQWWNRTVLLRNPLVLENSLPCDLEYLFTIRNENRSIVGIVGRGKSAHIPVSTTTSSITVQVRIHLPGLFKWSQKAVLFPKSERVTSIHAIEDSGRHLFLPLKIEEASELADTVVRITVPYIALNMSGHPISLRTCSRSRAPLPAFRVPSAVELAPALRRVQHEPGVASPNLASLVDKVLNVIRTDERLSVSHSASQLSRAMIEHNLRCTNGSVEETLKCIRERRIGTSPLSTEHSYNRCVPVLFSLDPLQEDRSSKTIAEFRLGRDSTYTQAIDMDTPSEGGATVEASSNAVVVDFAVAVSKGQGLLSDSTFLTIRPSIMLINHTKLALDILPFVEANDVRKVNSEAPLPSRPAPHDAVVSVQAGSTTPYYWLATTARILSLEERQVRLRVTPTALNGGGVVVDQPWSLAFPAVQPGDHHIALSYLTSTGGSTITPRLIFLNIESYPEKGTNVVHIRETPAPIVLRNETSRELVARQHGSKRRLIIIPPETSVKFAWDNWRGPFLLRVGQRSSTPAHDDSAAAVFYCEYDVYQVGDKHSLNLPLDVSGFAGGDAAPQLNDGFVPVTAFTHINVRVLGKGPTRIVRFREIQQPPPQQQQPQPPTSGTGQQGHRHRAIAKLKAVSQRMGSRKGSAATTMAMTTTTPTTAAAADVAIDNDWTSIPINRISDHGGDGNGDDSRASFDEYDGNGSDTESEQSQATGESPDDIAKRDTLRIALKGIGVSVVTNVRRDKSRGESDDNLETSEICYLTLADILVDYWARDRRQAVILTLQHLQLDNHTTGALWPVAIFRKGVNLAQILGTEPSLREKRAPTSSSSSSSTSASGASLTAVPAALLQAQVIFNRQTPREYQKQPLSLYHLIQVELQEVQMKLDDALCWELFKPFKTTLKEQSERRDPLADHDFEQGAVANVAHAYFEVLILSTININISMTFAPGDKEKEYHELVTNFIPSTFVAGLFLKFKSFVQVNDLPIELDEVRMYNQFMTTTLLLHLVQTEYVNQIVGAYHKFFASSDVLGNPSGLLRNFSVGFRDLIEQPARGLADEELLKGVGKGVKSFFKHSAVGLLNSTSKISNNVGRGLALASLDPKFQRDRENLQAPTGAGDGFLRGVTRLGQGIFEGATGIVQQPIKGAKEDGVNGFFKGVGRGVVGVLVKPVSGMVDFTSNVTAGFQTALTDKDPPRVRYCAFIRADRIIRRYDAHSAFGYHIVRSIVAQQLDAAKDEQYLGHVDMRHNDDNIAIVTNHRLLIVPTGYFKEKASTITYIDRYFRFSRVRGIARHDRGVSIDEQNSHNRTLLVIEDKHNVDTLLRLVPPHLVLEGGH